MCTSFEELEKQARALSPKEKAALARILRTTRKVTTVPRHREINDFLARKICRDLEIPQF